MNMDGIYIFLGFWVGAVIGSFINAAAMRSVAEKKWWGSERSVCDHCGRVLTAPDLIPVISYIVLQGHCRTCRNPIHPRHFLTEAGAGVIGALFVWHFGQTAALYFSFTALFFLLFHTLTDIECGYIYDSWALSMAVAGLLLRFWGGIPALIDGAAGAALGFIFIYAIVVISHGGMGMGDAMLMLGTGAMLGWKMTILSLYLGFMIGGVIVIPLLAAKKISRKDSIPLGPFLSAGVILTIFTGTWIFEYFGFSQTWPWII